MPDTTEQQTQWMTIREVQGVLRVSERTVRSMLADGRLRGFRLAGSNRVRVRREDVDAVFIDHAR